MLVTVLWENDENSDMSRDSSKLSKDQQFLKLFLANQKRIFGFIVSLVPNSANADDIMQETVGIMWQKFHTFEIGTNFSAWAISIARHKIFQFREKQLKNCARFSNKAIAEIISRSKDIQDSMDDRMDALQVCLKKLKVQDRYLVQMRYEKDIQTKQLAQQQGRSVNGLYKTMTRIHRVLQQCVQRTLLAWEVI